MSKLLSIIRREYLARVRSRWFIITTLLVPILIVATMALPILLVTGKARSGLSISVVDESGVVLPELLETQPFSDGRLRYLPPPHGPSGEVLDTLRERVLRDEISGYLFVPADVLEAGQVRFWGRDISQSLVRTSLRNAATTAVRRLRARELGLESVAVEKLTRDITLDTYRVTEQGVAREEEKTVITAHVLALAIYMVVLIYGAMMLRAAVAEKANKTVEIILSSVRPWQLMLGKTLGVGAVGLTQVGIWVVIVAAALIYVATAQSLAGVDFLQNLPLGADTLALFVGLFITGYFVYAGMYASAGAIASTEQEASQLQLPVTLLAIVPILVIPVVLEAPTREASLVLSWIPFFTPVLFIARYVLGAVRPWELPLVFAFQFLAILLIAWIGGRIYRVGLLMTGKRPTLPELIRWIRHG